MGYTGSRGFQGFTGSAGGDGFTGSKGDVGPSVQISGTVATVNDLDSNFAGSIGEGYLVQDTGKLYVWNGTIWVDVGIIQGPRGYTGSGGSGSGLDGAFGNFDGGFPDSNYGGIESIDAGGVTQT